MWPSVLWCCWLGGSKGIRPVKTEWWGAGVVICLEQGADLHMTQRIPLPLTVSCFSKIQIGFTFLVLAHLGSPGKGAVKRVCVCYFSKHFEVFFSNLICLPSFCSYILFTSASTNFSQPPRFFILPRLLSLYNILTIKLCLRIVVFTVSDHLWYLRLKFT